jgi:hypothetical protein
MQYVQMILISPMALPVQIAIYAMAKKPVEKETAFQGQHLTVMMRISVLMIPATLSLGVSMSIITLPVMMVMPALQVIHAQMVSV